MSELGDDMPLWRRHTMHDARQSAIELHAQAEGLVRLSQFVAARLERLVCILTGAAECGEVDGARALANVAAGVARSHSGRSAEFAEVLEELWRLLEWMEAEP